MFFSATDSTIAHRQNISFNLHILNFLNIDSTLGQVGYCTNYTIKDLNFDSLLR
jgi:hypothetical protein